MEGNTVKKASLEGIDWAGDGGHIIGNVFSKCGATGIWFDASATDNVLLENKVVKSAGHGIRLAGTGHFLVENTAKKSAWFDFDATQGFGYTLVDNVFGTTSF